MFNYKCVGKLIKVNTRIDFLLKDIFNLNTPINVLNLHSIIQTKNLRPNKLYYLCYNQK